MNISSDFFLKNRLVVMRLCRDLLSLKPDEQLMTIDHYVEMLSVSRGTVQKAMQFLIDQDCISTHFRGHLGTFLLTKNDEKLWEYSGLGTLSGAMSLPLNKLVAGLATGICDCMRFGNIPFNCIFVQGSRTRMKGLVLGKYDFVVASSLTESVLIKEFDGVEAVMKLAGCAYGGRYILLFADPEKSAIEDGMTVAVDPTSVDQLYLTDLLCEGRKGVAYNKLTYIETRHSVMSGESDVTVARTDVLGSVSCSPGQIKEISLPGFSRREIESFSETVIIARRDNYGLADILQDSLRPSVVANAQKKVMNGSRSPAYF